MAIERTRRPSFRLSAGIVLALVSPIALTVDFGSLSLADPILLISAILLLSDLRVRPTSSSHTVELLLLSYLVVMTASITLASANEEAYSWFSLSSSATAWLRFAQITLIFAVLSRAVRRAHSYVLRVVPRVSVGMALFALGAWILQLGLGVDSSFVSHSPGLWIPRAQGLFREPAELGLFLAMTFPFVVSLPESRRRVAVSAVLLAAIATVSPVAIGSVAVVALSWVLLGGQWFASASDQQVSNGALAVVGCVVVVVVASSLAADVGPRDTSLGSDYYAATVSRLVEASTGSGGSGYLRLYGSWRVAGHGLAHSPLLGSSPGNLGRLALARDSTLARVGITESHHAWNGAALVLGNTGLIGLTLFMGIGIVSFRRSPVIAVVFAAYLFGSSEIFDPTLWIILAAYFGMAFAAQPVQPTTERVGSRTPTHRYVGAE